MSTPPSPAIPSNLWLATDRKGLVRASELIHAGKLVVLPTETVYGIAVNLRSSEARSQATQIKGGVPSWVLHVARPEDVHSWAPHLSSMGRRLISKSLPGPVAFQIMLEPQDLAAAKERLGEVWPEALRDGCLTVRCPDLSIAQQILSEAIVPVAIIGAGASAPVFEVSDLPEGLINTGGAMSAGVEAVVDGGPTRYRRPSTVVRIDGERFSIVRAGVLDGRMIEKMADFQILFLCSGNTCRSPMAAALATRILADRLGIEPSELPLRHVVVQSAGLHANRGIRAAREAVEAVKPLKGDLSGHFSQPATIDLLRRADVIYTMTQAHRDEVLDLLPGAASKTHRLNPDADVEDPIGGGLEIYQDVAARLKELLENRLRELRI